MLVTITNATTEDKYISMLNFSLAAGASVTVSRDPTDLAGERQFRKDVETGDLTLAFATEDGDDAAIGHPVTLEAFANAAALPVATARPLFTTVWQTNANLAVWTDGTNWRRADGSITV
jgi:hypothetical protein